MPSVLISSTFTFAADTSTLPTAPDLAGPSHFSSIDSAPPLVRERHRP